MANLPLRALIIPGNTHSKIVVRQYERNVQRLAENKSDVEANAALSA